VAGEHNCLDGPLRGGEQDRLAPGDDDGVLMAAATAAAAASATGGAAGRIRGAAGARRGEDRELDGGFFAGALGAGDFLLLVDDDFFELGFAVFANVFVDWHLA
jgi:hypothetical protein